jgi:hypothetical protein
MKLSDPGWTYWSEQRFAPICPEYKVSFEFGTPFEPESSLWCASLLDPAKKAALLDGDISIADWGCGDGRLLDFICRRFKKFKYYGIEQSNAFGTSCIWRALSTFGKDRRVSIGASDSDLARKAIDSASLIILGSVATHIPIEETEGLFKLFLSALDRGAKIIASFFVGDSYTLEMSGLYGKKDCYIKVTCTQSQIEDLCRKHGLQNSEAESFLDRDSNLHRIFLFKKAGK